MATMEQTISVSRGKTAIEHDLREYIPNNVDRNMTKYNRVFINELSGKSLADYTNEYMKPFIEEYNQKQRRSDRKKSYDYAADYIQEQNRMQTARQNYTAGQLAYEYVIQFGDHESMNVNEVVSDNLLYEDVLEMFSEFLESYQKSYPHMKILLACVHMDEPKGTPHMHILVQPIGEGYKQGLSHQISLTKALACDGFARAEGKGERLSLTRWQDDIKDNIMEPILERHLYERLYKDGEKHHMPVALYKKTMEEKEKILCEAYEEADKITEQAESQANELVEQAEQELEELKEEKTKLLEGTAEAGPEGMSISELRQEYRKLLDKYKNLAEGYARADGSFVLGYHDLAKRHQQLLEEPERLLEMEAGQKALAKAKKSIVQAVYQNIQERMLGLLETNIVTQIKRKLVEPIYRAIDEMMYGYSFSLNEQDRRILERAIDETVDDVTKELGIGKAIEQQLQKKLPESTEIEEEVEVEIRRRRR